MLGNSSGTRVGLRTPCYSAERDSIFLSGASFLMKLKKKTPYNLIYVTFGQLWLISMLVLIYFLGGSFFFIWLLCF